MNTDKLNTNMTNSPIGAPFQPFLAGKARWIRCLYLCVSVFICGFASLSSHAQVPTPQMPLPSPELAKRLKVLESELRCLVCQNETLAESPAGLASDLRREVRSLVEQGKTDAEIKSYLQARYGDFVLYRPPLATKTYLLWFGPFGLLIVAGLSAWWLTRRRVAMPSTTTRVPETDSQQRARQLLESDDRVVEGNHK